MKSYLPFIAVLVVLMLYANKCITEENDRFANEEIRLDRDSGKISWMFKSSYGDTIYSTQFRRRGTPQLGPVFNNRGQMLYPVQWYYGSDQPWKWITVKDDKFRVSVNPNCQLIGYRE